MIRITPPVHPGEILREEYLSPLGLTPYRLAADLNVPRTRITRLCREETPVTTDTALRLARYFETSPEFWLAMQTTFDVTVEAERAAADLEVIIPRSVHAVAGTGRSSGEVRTRKLVRRRHSRKNKAA